ncbi:MAG: hypothetical protein AAF741_13700 [Bacteroidota bacterium]
MRFIALQILLLLLVSGCESADVPSALWARTHIVHHPNSPLADTISGSTYFLTFGEDSLFSKYFDYNLQAEETTQAISRNRSRDYVIFNIEKLNPDTFKYDKTSDLLYANMEYEYPLISYFKKMPKYALAHLKNETHDRLTQKNFILFDSLRIEFKENSCILTSIFNGPLDENNLWTLETFEEELFLFFSGFFGFVLHITEISEVGIAGTIYGLDDFQIVLKEVPFQKTFDLDDLRGKWTEVRETPRLLPPLGENSLKAYPYEELQISDSTILHGYIYNSDTLSWSLNREQDLILIEKAYQNRYAVTTQAAEVQNSTDHIDEFATEQIKWKIISLDSNYLLIERLVPRYLLKGDITERILFKKQPE